MLPLRFLSAIASLYIRIGRALAWFYTKLWSRYGLHWFDHRFDFLHGPQFWYWQERGVLGAQAIQAGDKVLDLCCGEGFYDLMYFSNVASHVDALDMDSQAIESAISANRRANVRFYVRDVVEDDFPGANYDAVLCFSAIQQLTEIQVKKLLLKIRQTMKPSGVFFGSVSIIPGNKILTGEAQLRSYFAPNFHSVELNSSSWPNGRTEWYFRCRNPILAQLNPS